jgi:hypothetical protein
VRGASPKLGPLIGHLTVWKRVYVSTMVEGCGNLPEVALRLLLLLPPHGRAGWREQHTAACSCGLHSCSVLGLALIALS